MVVNHDEKHAFTDEDSSSPAVPLSPSTTQSTLHNNMVPATEQSHSKDKELPTTSTSDDASPSRQTHSSPSSTEKAQQLPTPAQAGPPPDGGLTAWTQVAVSFCLFFMCWGVVNSFGEFQTYYSEFLIPDTSNSSISWIGSLQGFLLVFGGCITGPLVDLGYVRLLVTIGSVLVIVGMVLTSLCYEYYQLILAQGLLQGLGMMCLFLPAVSILPGWFVKRRALALGLGAAGSGLGGVIMPIMFHELVPQIGFGWTVRAIALVLLVVAILPIVAIKARVLPAGKRKLFQPRKWLEPSYSIFVACLFCAFLALYIPFFYLQLYSIENNVLDADLAYYLVPILSAGSVLGRIIPGFIADYAGSLYTLTFALFASTVLAFAWLGIDTAGGVIVFAALYGFFSGSIVSLCPTVTATYLVKDLRTLGTIMGMSFFPLGIAVLIGTPISGAVLTRGWPALRAFTGAIMAAGFVLALITKLALDRERRIEKEKESEQS